MPYIDPTGKNQGWSDVPQPAFGLTEYVEVAPEPSSVPSQVSAFQAKAALHNAGLLDAVEAYFAATDTDPVQVLAWHNATTFERSSPTLAAASAKLGMTSEQLDALFTAAAQLQA